MITWEYAAIGTALTDPASMDAAGDLLPQDFTRSNRLIWGEIHALSRRGSLDYRGVLEGLRSKGVLSDIGSDLTDHSGEAYLQFCMSYAGIQMGEYARQVIDSATKRSLTETASLIALDARTERDADEVLDEAERRIMSLRRGRGSHGVPMGEIIDAFIPKLEGMRTGAIVPALIPKLQAVKDIIGYIEDSDFIVVAGRPGEGKSSYLRYEGLRWAEQENKNVLVFNLENSEAEYARYAISLKTGIDSNKLKLPRSLSRNELERVRVAATNLKELPMEIVTLGSPSVAEVDRIARSKMRTFKPDVIILDYVQLIQNGIENRVQDVTLSSQVLRAMAMKNRLNIPVMVAAQLSRAIETRGGNSEPKLSDLRESGSLEQDPTIVMFIRPIWRTAMPPREEVIQYPENTDERGNLLPVIRACPTRFFVLKNRNGPVGVTGRVKWCKHTGDFQTLVRE